MSTTADRIISENTTQNSRQMYWVYQFSYNTTLYYFFTNFIVNISIAQISKNSMTPYANQAICLTVIMHPNYVAFEQFSIRKKWLPKYYRKPHLLLLFLFASNKLYCCCATSCNCKNYDCIRKRIICCTGLW